ncbi:MAG: 4Fe-4S binding protein [Candidatus Woesearchaeota archaeon]
MAKRKIIQINEEKCNGCGQCVPNCFEGALQIIDSKARLVSDLFCDGLGACIGQCPQNAIKIIEREALPYDETKVMQEMVKKGENTIRAHLEHLEEHGATKYLKQAKQYLKDQGINISEGKAKNPKDIQWPIQLHLVNPENFKGADVLIAADCTAHTYPNFHDKFLKGKKIVIACPKLDQNQDIYLDKMQAIAKDAKSITVAIMEVPCCMGLLGMVQKAAKKMLVKTVVVGIRGELIQEQTQSTTAKF